MFCSSLRKRADWSPIVPYLLQAKEKPWKERKLETHDIALPLGGPYAEQGGSQIRFLMLSAVDIDAPEIEKRIERLYHLDGGRNCAIVLHPNITRPQFAQLQIDIVLKFDIPLLRLSALEELPVVANGFHTELMAARAPSRPPRRPIYELIANSAVPPPMTEHAANVLSEIATGFGDLVDKVATPEGRQLIYDYLDKEDADRAIAFWTKEYTAN